MKINKKYLILPLAFVAVILTGCKNGETPIISVDEKADEITKITLDKHYASLFYNDKVGFEFNEDVQLSPVVYPRKSGKRDIVWESSNPDVATVDENGKVVAIKEGTSEVTVSNKDGDIKASCHIIVNNMNGQKISYCNTRLDDIVSRQNKSTFNMPDVVTQYETYNQTITKNGKLISRTYFTQNIQTSKENAYIKLDIDEIEWKCEDASPVLSSFQYVFYTTDQYESYLFKSSGDVKNFMSVNQSDYIGKGKLTALKAICNNFFTGGEEIIEENYTNILSQSALNDGWLSSSEKNEHYGRMDSVPGQLAFDLRESLNYYAYNDDEKDMQIPVGTQYKLDIYDRLVFENFLLTGKYIEQSATYIIGEDSYVNKITVDSYYKVGEEIDIPNKENYSKVDSIFSL